MKLGSFDIKILQTLQQQADISNQALAEQVGLTTAPCSRRVKQLQDKRIIQGYTARLNEQALNLNLTVLLQISMDKHVSERFAVFEEQISLIPEVIECYLIAGNQADYQLKIVVPDMAHYHDILLKQITRIPGVSGVQSAFILSKIFEHKALPLGYIR